MTVHKAAPIALQSAYQWWLAYDAHFSAALNKKPRDLNADWVREIARPYGFARTLGGDRYAQLAGQVAKFDIKPGMSMCERAEHIVQKLGDWENGLPLSAASKLSWFTWPSGWTMFDTFACATVRPVGKPGPERFKDFYRRLDSAGFAKTADEIRHHLPSCANPLLAERVIDSFLVHANAADLDRRIAARDNFVSALPEGLRTELLQASHAIAPKLEAFAEQLEKAPR